MANVDSDLIYEVLKSIQVRLAGLDGKAGQLKQKMQAFRTHMIGLQQDISGIHSTLVRYESRLDRIEQRLELNAAPTL